MKQMTDQNSDNNPCWTTFATNQGCPKSHHRGGGTCNPVHELTKTWINQKSLWTTTDT